MYMCKYIITTYFLLFLRILATTEIKLRMSNAEG